MKMSFVWLILLASSILSVIIDVTNNSYDFWFYLNFGGALASGFFLWDARQTEAREAEAKKQLITIVVNHFGGEPADVTAKRVADLKKLL
jgi:hypothetical protein